MNERTFRAPVTIIYNIHKIMAKYVYDYGTLRKYRRFGGMFDCLTSLLKIAKSR